jgi:hypothetical protein
MWQFMYPFASLLAGFIIESLLEAVDYQTVGPFDLSVGLGCATDTYFTAMHAFSQNSQNWLAMKLDPVTFR